MTNSLAVAWLILNVVSSFIANKTELSLLSRNCLLYSWLRIAGHTVRGLDIALTVTTCAVLRQQDHRHQWD
jgi:hypothetical protein